MANTLITPDWITKTSARLLLNNLKFAGNVNRNYDDQYVQSGAKVGYTVKARLPQRFRTTKGQAFQQQNITDSFVPVTLTDQANVAISFSSASMTMEVDSYRERYVKPASEQLANTIDYDGLSRCFLDVYHFTGTPGTTPTSNLPYLQAVAILADAGAPVDGLNAILTPQSMITLANANQTLFNPARYQSDAFRKGQFAGEALGIGAWYQDQNVARFTTGSFTTASPEVLNGGQTGATLIVDGAASGATVIPQGSTFTVEGVYEVNPQNYQSTGRLQQFVVTADIVDATGTLTIPISPSIITSGQNQTVTASPANNADVLFTGATAASSGVLTATSTAQNLVYHEDAFTMVMADLEMPEGGAMASRVSNNQLGVALRFAKQWNIQTDQNAARLDCLYGWKTIRPQLAVRVYGGA